MFSGKKIYMLRKAKGLSQDKLAELAGISQPYVSKLESCERVPTITVVSQLAKILGCELTDFIEEDERRTL